MSNKTARDSFVATHRYARAEAIDERFGSSAQGWVSAPETAPYVFVFAQPSRVRTAPAHAGALGSVIEVIGEEQRGNAPFTAANTAIRDHAADSRDLFLFQGDGAGTPYTFVGELVCAGWRRQPIGRWEGGHHDAIVFSLVDFQATSIRSTTATNPSSAALATLRAEAYAALPVPEVDADTDIIRSAYERSLAIRDYVLARSVGRCESCVSPTPLRGIDGAACLQSHHMRRQSDGGPDDPQALVALCPDCHRRVHSDQDGKDLNHHLAQLVHRLETSLAEVRGG